MILWLLDLLGGWYIVRGCPGELTDFLNLCMRFCYPYTQLREDETGFCFRVRRRIWREMAADAASAGICLTIAHEGGWPRIFRRYRWRWGLMVGSLLAVGLVVLSGRFVWRIEVNGTDNYTPRDVMAELEALGFGVGSYIPDVEVNALQTALLLTSDRFAWVSVNLHGTTAEIEVVEHTRRESLPRQTSPANLIAAADGQITGFELRGGWTAVSIGDVVCAGQLLVSAIGETKDARSVVGCAEGKVWAQVVHSLSVEIPFDYTTKRYTGEKSQEKRMIFFGKVINLFRSTGISGGSCDIIDNERILSFFGRWSLPVSLCTTTRLAYVEQPARRDEAAARRLAELAMREQIDALGAEGGLLRRIDTTTVTEDGFRLESTVWCIENIAKRSPITLGIQAEVPPS